MRPSVSGKPTPVAGQWVVLHRVGSDSAAPLDSVQSSAEGRFRFRYTPSGAESALYFVSARHDGIAYFSSPLRTTVVRGGDADIIVYDTTRDTTTLRVQGRHLVVSAPRGTKREIAEVFELENEGTTTIVARDATTPLWSAHLPEKAESASVAQGDIGAGAVEFRNGRAEVYAPVSPGVRQLVVTYLLPASDFPLVHPVERSIAVLEVLLEEPRASAGGAKLVEVSPATIEGRTFHRYLAQDVPSSAIIRVDAPAPAGQSRAAMTVLFVVMGLAMLGALVAWTLRNRPPAAVRHPSTVMDQTIAELATLDAQFERNPTQRAEYEARRGELKARIARELAAEKRPA